MADDETEAEARDCLVLEKDRLNLPTISGHESWELMKPLLWPAYHCLKEVWQEDPEMDFDTFADVAILSIRESMESLESARFNLRFKGPDDHT